MEEDLFRILQAVGIVTTIILGLIAAVKGLIEYDRANRIREEELKWKKSVFGSDLWTKHRSGRSSDCMKLLDWSGREFEISAGIHKQIWWPEMLAALRTRTIEDQALDFHEDEVFVRDCFDNLLQDYADFEVLIENGLLDPSQIIRYCGYYVRKIIEHDDGYFEENGVRPIEEFMRTYGFKNSWSFCSRHSEWKNRKKALRRSRWDSESTSV